MLYYLSQYLTQFWGPFRLLQSHALLLAGGAFTAAFLTLALLPRLWDRLPRDRGKVLCKDLGGMKSAGKPTGAGFYVTLICLPVILLFAPLRFWDIMAVAMLTGWPNRKGAANCSSIFALKSRRRISSSARMYRQ